MDITTTMNWETLLDLLLGIGLSAAAGFRVFVPLLVMSAAAVLGHFDLPADFDWIETDQALIVFAIASLVEIVGYYVPFLDVLLDTIATPAAIIAGTLITASLASDLNPFLQWTVAIIAGGGTAGLTKGTTAVIRVIATAVFAGLSNPIIATIELALAILLTVLAITVPVLTSVLLVTGFVIAVQRIRKFFRREAPPTSPDVVA
ncbi:DUF4126 domain-containing protein [Thermocoleostomius sinensis]|jgi:hypothetical protein|uniref:DUF4126 domain-containing protein n=1 Tax=Thermocoleostomius sinensis A174 TaxID=2016057 RepID=A0A9E9CBV8_9CYAN|nr:DUF4126 domain-containing protein [Thermocoleostomius sinensis]WAL61280.1 DUF4126 domain-containing protein [Thermocoleostomius sinensis A174]